MPAPPRKAAVVKVPKTVAASVPKAVVHQVTCKAVVHQVTLKAMVVQVAFKETSSRAEFKAAKENFKI